ncbi:MAG TPA: TlpA disulfide reductase family protein [Dissulfurispiraceae bacterium]|nr:TlpA disulfide reductase family protein [Dissulfurispiraceae bacterium]
MKNKSIILVAILVVGIALAYFLSGKEASKEARKAGPVPKTAAVGLQAPDFELADINNRVWRLSDLRGKVVLITFWATWCDSCSEENPSLQKLIASEKDNKDFVALTLLYDDSAQNAVSYLKRNNFTFNVLLDDRKASSDYGITGVPETFVISKKGIVSNKIVGPIDWETPEVKAAIRKLTEES